MSESKEENSTQAADVKEEDKSQKADENKSLDESSKDSEKDSAKEDSVKEESEKESGKEESDDEEEEVGLLDRPVEVYGCRARKQVDRLEVSFSTKEKQMDIPEGKGDKLGDCPSIEFQIGKTSINDLKPLHRILFNRTGSGHEIKKNVRKFSGFTFPKESTDYDRKKASLEKLNNAVLKKMCEVLNVERKGHKDDIVNRLLDFFLLPKDSGKGIPKGKQPSKDKKKTAEKKTNKKVKSKKEASSGDESNSADEGTSEQNNEEDNDKEDADSDEEEIPKKSKAAKGKKTPAKAAAKKPEKKEKVKKEEKKTTKAAKRKRDDSSEPSDEEPSSKKAKMPTDDEIKKLVKRILDAADLQEITMKKVIKQVSEAYPDSDLSHKKAFIKSTIKSVIS